MRTAVKFAPLAAALLLGACNEESASPRAVGSAQAAPARVDVRTTEAMRLTEERLRARLRAEGALTQRAVQVHPQAMPNTVAVCGQVNPSGRSDQPFIPYVAVISFEGERAARGDLHIGVSTPEATRVYLEMVDRCFEGGGPSHARSAGRPMPPAPGALPEARDTIVNASASTAASNVAPAVAGSAGVTGAATIRSAANVRSAPSSSGAVIRTAPRGASLQVFGQAPGGWFQVGEAEPWGWVHGSLLETR